MNVKDRVAVITGSARASAPGSPQGWRAAGARIVVNDLDPYRVDGTRIELRRSGRGHRGDLDVSTAAGAGP